MRNGTTAFIGVAFASLALAGCTNDETTTPDLSTERTTQAPLVVASLEPPLASKTDSDALRDAAMKLDIAASSGDAETAWSYYSQRCKNQIGSLDAYKSVLSVFYAGRDPQPTDWTVKVNGSSGQVVTVDEDPNAPASAMAPRTWTLIDDQWQFDNC